MESNSNKSTDIAEKDISEINVLRDSSKRFEEKAKKLKDLLQKKKKKNKKIFIKNKNHKYVQNKY